jgi:hypothetical protein
MTAHLVSGVVKAAPHNNRVQRTVCNKVHGRGRVSATPVQVMCARVPNELRPVADAGRWASLQAYLQSGHR